MRDILGRGQRAVLRDLASRRTLLAFDFDGTLAPIVRAPPRARLRPGTARLLRAVAERWPCAVVSGRARRDVLERLGGVPVRWVVGNHGAEGGSRPARASQWRRAVGRWRRELLRDLGGLPGVEVEDKGLSLAVHHRRARDAAAARRAVAAASLRLRGARLVPGKRVLNVVPARAPDKGVALAALARRGRFERVLFAGDDDTDEDVFRRDLGIPAVTVRVGRSAGSAAAYSLRGQAAVDGLLEALLRARKRSGATAARPRGVRKRRRGFPLRSAPRSGHHVAREDG